MISSEDISQFEQTFLLCFPDISSINREDMFALAACMGKNPNPTGIDQLWPSSKERINMDEAWNIYNKLKSITFNTNVKGVLRCKDIDRKINMMSLDKVDRLHIERYLREFHDNQDCFQLNKFIQSLNMNRNVFCDELELIREYWVHVKQKKDNEENKDPAGEDVTNEEEQSIHEDSSKDEEIVILTEDDLLYGSPIPEEEHPGHLSHCDGFLTVDNKEYSIAVAFGVKEITKASFSFKVNRNNHIPDDLFKNDLVGYIINQESKEIIGVTSKLTKTKLGEKNIEVFSTDKIDVPPGDYFFSILRLRSSIDSPENDEEETIEEGSEEEKRKEIKKDESNYNPSDFVRADGMITAKFRNLLYDIFDIFDINSDKVLSVHEFNLFTELSEDHSKNSEVELLTPKEWSKMAELFSFDRKVGMPLIAFVNMFKAEIRAGSEALMDVAINMKNLGINGKFEMTRFCPYSIGIRSSKNIVTRSRMINLSVDTFPALTNHLFDKGEEMMEYDMTTGKLEYSFHWRLFRTSRHAVLIARNVVESLATTYFITINNKNNCDVYWNNEGASKEFRNNKSESRTMVVTIFSTGNGYSFDLILTKQKQFNNNKES